MTELEWLTTVDHPQDMVQVVKGLALPERKKRLLVCALAILIEENTNPSPNHVEAIEAALRHADGQATDEELIVAGSTVSPGIYTVCLGTHTALDFLVRADSLTYIAACHAIREVIGNPYRSDFFEYGNPGTFVRQDGRTVLGVDRLEKKAFFKREWAYWNDGVIPRLAASIYKRDAFLELPVLADALEEAGCQDLDLLLHLRDTKRHFRGCWALDLVHYLNIHRMGQHD